MAGSVAVGPNKVTVTNAARAAIFYVDPDPQYGAVVYRGDGIDPRTDEGLPIRPGGHIVLVGNGNIVNARFIAQGNAVAKVHALYYDAVDIVAADILGSEGVVASAVETQALLRSLLAEVQEIKRGQQEHLWGAPAPETVGL